MSSEFIPELLMILNGNGQSVLSGYLANISAL